MISRFLYALFLLIISIKETAQEIDEKDFILYGPKEGLSDNYVSGIEQDSLGFIWIATHYGLNRFDGKTFRHFLHNDTYDAIPDNSIYSMRRLPNGKLAIATDDGVQIISTSTLQQLNLSIADDDDLRYWSNACRSVACDAAGNYGVSTKTGFYIFSSSGKIKKRFDYYTRKNIGEWMLFGDDLYLLPDGNMVQLNQDGLLLYDRNTNQVSDASTSYPAFKDVVKEKNNNLFFFVSNTELVHINIETNSFDLVDIASGKIGSFPSCISLISDIGWITAPVKINETTWAVNCKTRGFFLLTIDLKKKSIFCSPQRYFHDKLCTAFFVDRNNHLWIGTTEGLLKQDTHPKIVESFALQTDTGKPVTITALYIGRQNIYAGTADQKILVLDKKTKSPIHQLQLKRTPGISNNIRSFYLYHPDTLWIGTNSGLWWMSLKNYSNGPISINTGPENHTVYSFFGDSRGNIWIVTATTNTLYYFDRNSGSFRFINTESDPLLKTTVTSLAEDQQGNIWMAGDAIFRWNGVTKRIDTLIDHINGQSNIKRGYHVMADSKKEIWTTVPDDGLFNLNRSFHIRPSNLFPDKNAFISPEIIWDRILLSTTSGPGYFDIPTEESVLLTANDGVPDGIITSYFFTGDSSDGSAWFSVRNMICKWPTGKLTRQYPSPDLHLTGMSILNDTLINYPSQKISLNYKQRNINILYSAINYTDPENMRFAYRIKNKKDSSWIDAGDQQNILLTNIAPGNYKIELRVSAFDNKWAEQIKELEIEVQAPFWQTPLFYIFLAIIFVAIIYSIYRYRIRQINQKANLDKLIAQTEIKALHAQMNPHFIFNCLNSIREMILHNENEQASLYLSRFARLIRITLNQSANQFVSLADTIDYLRRYIEMEKIRSSFFTHTIEVSEDLQTDDILVPPMLIQPFIENALWHGVSPNKNIEINIRFRKKENELICTVEDNGIGIEESLKKKEGTPHEQSVGIANIKQRIDLLNEKYNFQSSVTIEDKSNLPGTIGTGTLVTLHLPIKSNESLWAT